MVYTLNLNMISNESYSVVAKMKWNQTTPAFLQQEKSWMIRSFCLLIVLTKQLQQQQCLLILGIIFLGGVMVLQKILINCFNVYVIFKYSIEKDVLNIKTKHIYKTQWTVKHCYCYLKEENLEFDLYQMKRGSILIFVSIKGISNKPSSLTDFF